MIIKNIKEEKIQPEFTKRFLKRKSLIIKNISNDSVKKSSFNKELLKNRKKTNLNLETDTELINKDSLTKSSNFMPTLRKTQAIGYRNIKLLKSFLTEYKKIKSRRLTKLTLKQQRQLSKSVKRARMLKLFDLRKTLKPKKFLNFEKKVETLQVLLIMKLINLDIQLIQLLAEDEVSSREK